MFLKGGRPLEIRLLPGFPDPGVRPELSLCSSLSLGG